MKPKRPYTYQRLDMHIERVSIKLISERIGFDLHTICSVRFIYLHLFGHDSIKLDAINESGGVMCVSVAPDTRENISLEILHVFTCVVGSTAPHGPTVGLR